MGGLLVGTLPAVLAFAAILTITEVLAVIATIVVWTSILTVTLASSTFLFRNI
jgi:hypothetical protein